MNEHLNVLLQRHPSLRVCATDLIRAFDSLCTCFSEGGKLLVCGNGGSAADADHIAGELLKSFESSRPLPVDLQETLGIDLARRLQGALPVIPLTGFNAFSTAFQNDHEAEYAFAQLTHALGRERDALFCISTSGNSRNIVHAAKVARSRRMVTIALTGHSGGAVRDLVDICIRVPETDVAAIQELHLPIYHALCRMLESHFFEGENIETPPRTLAGGK